MGNTTTAERKFQTGDESDMLTNQYLTFYSGNELYGMPVLRTREVLSYKNVYVVPRTPKYLCGVINVRGEVVPVIDLGYLFYKKNTDVTAVTGIILSEAGDNGETVRIGLVIDRIEAVINLANEQIGSVPEFSLKVDPEYVAGIGSGKDGFIVLLDMDKLISLDTLSRY